MMNRTLASLVFGALTGLMLATCGCSSSHPAESDSAEPPKKQRAAPVVITPKMREAAWLRIIPRLEQFDSETADDIEVAIDSIEDFFKEKSQGARPFAAETISLYGKFQHLKGAIDSDARQRYLKDCFARHIFTDDELAKTLESVISQFISKMKARESQLLVQIRADLSESDLGPELLAPFVMDDIVFRKQFDLLVEQVAPDVSRDIGIDITKQVLDWEVATPLLAKIGAELAARLGLSGTILGTGAASGVATFGIGIVVGIVMDRFLDWVFRMAGHDPEAKIAAKASKSLDQFEGIIIRGYWRGPPSSIYLLFEKKDGTVMDLNDPTEGDVLGDPSKLGGLTGHLLDILEIRNQLYVSVLQRLIFEGEFQ